MFNYMLGLCCLNCNGLVRGKLYWESYLFRFDILRGLFGIS